MDWLRFPNPTRALTKTEARGLRRLYLTAGMARPAWDTLHFQVIQDKFGRNGYAVVAKLVRDGFLRGRRRGEYASVWYVTPKGRAAFLAYVQKHGMPKR